MTGFILFPGCVSGQSEDVGFASPVCVEMDCEESIRQDSAGVARVGRINNII